MFTTRDNKKHIGKKKTCKKGKQKEKSSFLDQRLCLICKNMPVTFISTVAPWILTKFSGFWLKCCWWTNKNPIVLTTCNPLFNRSSLCLYCIRRNELCNKLLSQYSVLQKFNTPELQAHYFNSSPILMLLECSVMRCSATKDWGICLVFNLRISANLY